MYQDLERTIRGRGFLQYADDRTELLYLKYTYAQADGILIEIKSINLELFSPVNCTAQPQMSSLKRELLKNKLPPLPNQYSGPSHSSSQTRPVKRKRDYSPVSWDTYFDECRDVKIEDGTFRVYTSGSDGPVLLLLHGGGHSALSWAIFSKTVSDICHCRIFAIDLRGHGHTKTTDDSNLSADILTQDVADIIESYFQESVPPVVLIGHSMGGAIAVRVAVSNLLPSLVGLVVIDVVEGTALSALSMMDNFLRSRPKSFKSLDEAIEWSIRSGQLRNIESAKVSIPGQVMRCLKDQLKTSVPQNIQTTNPQMFTISEDDLGDEIVRHKNEELTTNMASQVDDNHVFTWRIDLTKTEVHWEGWFKNMSSLFLSAPVPKLLVLAGIDRLDTDLSIGQMQGKFQMQVFRNCGHSVHEDAPDKLAEVLVGFLTRNKATQPKGHFEKHMPAC